MLRVLARGTNYLFGRYLHKKKIFIGNSLVFLNRERNIDKNYFDYIRLATLELVSYEIAKKTLEGSVADIDPCRFGFHLHVVRLGFAQNRLAGCRRWRPQYFDRARSSQGILECE